MLHEKPSDSFHWKNKLDALDHLPGEPVQDKTASWQKLHDRLREKPVRNKVILYWVAAASILFIVGGQWLMVDNKNTKIVNAKEQRIPAPYSNSTKTIIVDPELSITDATVEKKHESPIATRKQPSHKALRNVILIENKILPAPDTTTEKLPDVSINSMKTVDTNALVSFIPPKRKLRVVHINELGKPVEEEIQFARNNSSPTFQSKVFNQDRFSGFTVSRNSSDNLVKIKLSPSN